MFSEDVGVDVEAREERPGVGGWTVVLLLLLLIIIPGSNGEG